MAVEVQTTTMKNMELEVNGDILWIKVDLTQRYGPSKSGKTTVIATSGGNIAAPGHPDIKVGVNVYTK